MTNGHFGIWLLLAFFTVACASPQDRIQGESAGGRIFDAGPPRFSFTAFDVPAMRVKADIDEDEPGRGIVFNANLDVGEGFGGRFGVRYGDSETSARSLGVTYVQADHDDRTTGAAERTHGVLVDASWHHMLAGTERGGLEGTVGVGTGFMFFDFDAEYEDEFSLAAAVTGRLELVGWSAASVGVGGTGFLVGYPSETVAYGGYLELSVTARF